MKAMTTTSRQLEGDLQKRCMGWLKSQPHVYAVNVYGNAVQTGGTPDILICKAGRFIAVELKRPDGKGVLDPRQEATLRRIDDAGGITEVVDSFERFKEIINDCV